MTRRTASDRDETYEAVIEWLKLVLAVVTAAALTVIYLLIPTPQPGSFAEFIKACLPNIVSALIVFPTVYIVLGRANLNKTNQLAREIQRGINFDDYGRAFTNDVSGTADLVQEIVTKKSSQRIIKIEILAFTGGTFTTALLRDLVQLNPNKLDITLHTIDFARGNNSLFPSHWEHEEAETVARLKELCEGQAKLKIWRYPSFPFLLGMNIDDSHLLITFPSWDLRTGRLADKSLEYRHYRRHASAEHLFDLFENWNRQPDQTLLYASPARDTK